MDPTRICRHLNPSPLPLRFRSTAAMATTTIANVAVAAAAAVAFLILTHAAASAAEKLQSYIVRVDEAAKPTVFAADRHWYASAAFVDHPDHLLHSYDTVFSGFSALLSPARADALASTPHVLAVIPDRRRHLHTTRSPQFVGLRNQHGLWSQSDYGADVIVGVLDTGVWPERRSFSDLHLGPVPSRWRGACEPGERFSPSLCNRKLVGARSFSSGHQAAAVATAGDLAFMFNTSGEFRSPRDADGHGTHTASTAAGRHAFRASMAGYAGGIAKGVAPKARVAAYKVCWKDAGCYDSDILAGFDHAVADGVDVISISIGGGDGAANPYYLDPIALGSFGAASRGVFVASSAGNEGPTGMSVTNVAPWLTTVGAGTIDRNFPAVVVLGDGRRLTGVSLYSGKPLAGKTYPIVYPGASLAGGLSASLCMEDTLDPKVVAGKIVICDRGSNPRVAKGMVVKKAGGLGMILANGMSNGEGLVGDAHLLPACAVGAAEGEALKSYASKSSSPPTATIEFHGTVVGVKPAPVVASFSGRGPNALTMALLKPDLVAPGVNILAAWTDAVGPTGLDVDKRMTEFNILSGTSMACPHVAGAAALLKSAHPDWSPSAVRSAMMTTASLLDNRGRPITDESDGKPATPLDFGSGHLNLGRAMDPGLVYDLSVQDYVVFLCSIGYNQRTIQVITRTPVSCPSRKPAPENLNYPSISAVFIASVSSNATKSFLRTATNVGAANAVYRPTVQAPNGVRVGVRPRKLVFTQRLQKQSYIVTVTADTKSLNTDDSGAVFGALSWSDGSHVVRSPIVVSRVVPL